MNMCGKILPRIGL